MFLYAQNLKLTEDTQTAAHFLGLGGLVCTTLGAQPVPTTRPQTLETCHKLRAGVEVTLAHLRSLKGREQRLADSNTHLGVAGPQSSSSGKVCPVRTITRNPQLAGRVRDESCCFCKNERRVIHTCHG